MARFIEEGEKPTAYDSILVSPEKLSIFGSQLSLKIVRELSKKPGCAMDLSRRLEQHEQKVYYHLRNLENAGIIKQIRKEQRYGMTAKIYDVVSPVVATKLYNSGYELAKTKQIRDARALKFLYPFVKDRRLNATVIFGDPYPHGKYDSGARDAAYALDLLMFIGTLVEKASFPTYRVDIETNDKTLRQNLIVIGGPKSNTVTEKFNDELPLRFKTEPEWHIVSTKTGKKYTDPRDAIVVKCNNPFNEKKKLLYLAGIRTRGMRTAVMAVTNCFAELMKNSRNDGRIFSVVGGQDMDGDGVIDSVKILE